MKNPSDRPPPGIVAGNSGGFSAFDITRSDLDPLLQKSQHSLTTLKDLVPYMAASTYVALSLLFLQWSRKSWPYKIADLSVWIACLCLHQLKQPQLMLDLGLGYTVWNLLPGCLASITIPSHSAFIRSLKVLDDSEGLSECKICWSDEGKIAELPCAHSFCIQCLQEMGKTKQPQTICPICRLPLFSEDDRLMLVVWKGSAVGVVLNLAFGARQLVFLLMQGEYWWAMVALAMISGPMLCLCLLALELRATGLGFQEYLTSLFRARSTSDNCFLCGCFIIFVLGYSYSFWLDYKTLTDEKF